eukprot:TRINITY_DN72143_c0_g1_i1.p3 TRINITY_DN72143_c0_g1~~TRINITY_DN72143_c0_g1_i1.p3  ORF type:complete len:109 (+),score=30.06 TRINITY_DN72143_c0_g1_i1:61-387(+)
MNHSAAGGAGGGGGSGGADLPARPRGASSTSAAASTGVANRSWQWFNGAPGTVGAGFFGATDGKASDEQQHFDASARDRKVLENILGELRREVDRLDEDAWMFKKLPF